MSNKLNGIDIDRMDYVTRDGKGLGIATIASFDWRLVYSGYLHAIHKLLLYYYNILLSFLVASRYVEFIRVLDVEVAEGSTKVPCICPRDKVSCTRKVDGRAITIAACIIILDGARSQRVTTHTPQTPL